MPTYVYQCASCDHEFEKVLKIVDFDTPCEQPCPECSALNSIARKICMPHHGDITRMKMHKVDPDFRDVLRNIHRKSPGSNLDQSSTITKI